MKVWRLLSLIHMYIVLVHGDQRGLNTKRSTIVFFLAPTKTLSNHLIRQSRTGDAVLVKSRDMTGRTQTLPWWLRGEGVKTITYCSIGLQLLDLQHWTSDSPTAVGLTAMFWFKKAIFALFLCIFNKVLPF
jgi:hypothetical protein